MACYRSSLLRNLAKFASISTILKLDLVASYISHSNGKIVTNQISDTITFSTDGNPRDDIRKICANFHSFPHAVQPGSREFENAHTHYVTGIIRNINYRSKRKLGKPRKINNKVSTGDKACLW